MIYDHQVAVAWMEAEDFRKLRTTVYEREMSHNFLANLCVLSSDQVIDIDSFVGFVNELMLASYFEKKHFGAVMAPDLVVPIQGAEVCSWELPS